MRGRVFVALRARVAIVASLGIIAVSVGGLGPNMRPASASTESVIAKGDLAVSLLNGQVDEYTPSGTFVQTLLDASDGLSLPTGSAFDGAGNLYVTDFSGNRIFKRDAMTGAVTVFIDNVSIGNGQRLNSPESIVFDKGYSHMFVSGADRSGPGGGINIISTVTGTGAGFYPLPSSAGSEGSGESDWLAFDASSNLFMTNENPVQGVMRVDPASGDIAQPSLVPNLPDYGYALSFDRTGNVWVGDTGSILEFTSTGSLIRTIRNPDFSLVFAAVFNTAGDEFFAGDLNTGNVYTYDLNGSLQRTFNAAGGVSGLSVAGAAVPPNVGNEQSIAKNGFEPSIAVNPKDPNNIIVGYATGPDSLGGGVDCAYAVTKDGGTHWVRNILLSPKGLPGVNGDSSVAFGPNGDVYYACLAGGGDLLPRISQKNAVIVARSADGGVTFGTPSVVKIDSMNLIGGTFDDQEDVAVGPDDTPYVCYNAVGRWTQNIQLARAADPSMSKWSIKTASQSSHHANGCSVSVSGSGRVYVAWWDHQTNTAQIVSTTTGIQHLSNPTILGSKGTNAFVDEGVLDRQVWVKADPGSGQGGAVTLWSTAVGNDDVGHVKLSVTTDSTTWAGRDITGIDFPRLPTVAFGVDGSVGIGAYGGDGSYTVGRASTAVGAFSFQVVAGQPSGLTLPSASVPHSIKPGLGDYTGVAIVNGVAWGAWTDDRNPDREIYVGHS